MTFDEVRACLEQNGWPVEPVSEVTLRSRFRSGDRVFPLFVHVESISMAPRRPSRAIAGLRKDGAAAPLLGPTYATFAVIPFARLPADETGDPLADRLLELNREMNLAKFSLDEDGDVILSIEYPLADLDPSEVKDAVDLLSFYTEKYLPEVQGAVAAAET